MQIASATQGDAHQMYQAKRFFSSAALLYLFLLSVFSPVLPCFMVHWRDIQFFPSKFLIVLFPFSHRRRRCR